MKVLITGGNGFIARNLVEQLPKAYSVSAVSRKELDLTDSLQVFEYLKKGRFDCIIHAATYDAAPRFSTKDPAKVLENNLRMFFNIARCDGLFGKMIYYGSGAEFGRENWQPLMKETYFDQHIPGDQYGFSKYIMCKYAQVSKNIYNLRLFAVFGKYEDWKVRFISNACCNAIAGLPIVINQNSRFDFLYIDDLVRITEWFIDNNPKQHVYNVCTARAIDFKTIAERIVKLSGRKPDIVLKDQEGIREYSGDNSLLLSELKDFKFSSFDDSMRDLYGWYEDNKGLIEKDKLQIDWRRQAYG